MAAGIQDWLRHYVNDPAFLAKYRYYAAILARLDPVDDPYVHVMAVSARSARFYLHVHVDFFLNPPTNLQYLKGVLLHEVHHIVLGHLSQTKFRTAVEPDLMELAMEISANEYIREPLPGQPPRWNDFVQYGITAGQSTLERYEKLRQARREGKPIPVGLFVDEHLAHGVSLASAGRTLPDPTLVPRVKRLIQTAVAEARRQVGTGLSGGLLAGQEPGNFLEELSQAETPTFMDWKTALQMFVARLRAPIHTYHRPSRRFPDQVGIIPGRLFTVREAERPHVLVAIDTSSSMSNQELSEIAWQLRPLSDHVRITVVECDVVIQRVYPFTGSIAEVAGRGGTDLRPVFDRAFLDEHRPEGVIYFTDGDGPYLADDPGVKTLWVLSKPLAFGCPWGKKAELPRGAGAASFISGLQTRSSVVVVEFGTPRAKVVQRRIR